MFQQITRFHPATEMSLVPYKECTLKIGKSSFNVRKVAKERLRKEPKPKFFEHAFSDMREIIAHDGANLPATLMGKHFTQVKVSTWESSSIIEEWMEEVGLPDKVKVWSEEQGRVCAQHGGIKLVVAPLDEVALDHDTQEEVATRIRSRKPGRRPTYFISIGYYFEILDDWTDSSDSEEEDLYSEDEV